MHTKFLAGAALFALGVLASARAEAAPDCHNTTLPGIRLLTYNTFLNSDAPGTPNSEDAYAMSQAERAELIAQKILEDLPDVVLLTEVNDDEARERLIVLLGAHYPAQIEELDEHDTDNDSGLMLFSRYRFTYLDQMYGTHDDDFYVAHNETGFNVNWKLFPSSMTNGGDAWMNKGIAFVRIANDCNNGNTFVVGLSHTQSEGSPDDPVCVYGEDMSDRNEQRQFMRDFYRYSVDANKRNHEPFFMMGDLNVDGDVVGANTVTSKDRVVYLTENVDEPCGFGEKYYNEWELAFDSRNPNQWLFDDRSDGFWSCRGRQKLTFPCDANDTFMIDSWAHESSPLDAGQTNSGYNTGGALAFDGPNDGQRLDYILHNNPTDRRTGEEMLCMQHIRRGFPKGGSIALSDHLPVSADFNRPAFRCSMRPRKAGDPLLPTDEDANIWGPARVHFETDDASSPNFQDVIFSNVDPDGAGPLLADTETGIAFPGSVQWYVIDQAYPYVISTEPTDAGAVGYEVYQGRDMSNRQAAYDGECETDGRKRSCLYLLTEPPYYVKVFAATNTNPDFPDRTRVGGYKIKFHRLDCSSKEEACPLDPGRVAGPYLWPANQLLNPDLNTDKMWFRFQNKFPITGENAPNFSVFHDFPSQYEQPDGSLIDFQTISVVKKNGVAVTGYPNPASPDWNEATVYDPVQAHQRGYMTAEDALPGLTIGRGHEETYYLTIERDPNYIADTANQWVIMYTSHTYFRPMHLACIEERTWDGSDDLAAKFEFDLVEGSYTQIGAVGGDYETWDEQSSMNQYGTPNVARSNWPATLDQMFTNHMKPFLYEDYEDGDNYLMNWDVQGDTIAGLNTTDHGETIDSQAKFVYSDEPNRDDAYYWYEMKYIRSHRRLPPRGLGDCAPGQAYLDQGTGEYRCACIQDLACDHYQNGEPTGQHCNVTTGRCEY